ncbi:MAG: RiPP maturation radical SAM C-methyltransferase [Candidatus Binatia bacterium]
MFKIGLINMPFSAVQLPSIALTQIKYVLTNNLADRVEPKIYYLNHDFAQYLGQEHYSLIANSLKSTLSGLGDWFCRLVAFPGAAHNTEAYFSRHLWQFERKQEIAQLLNEKRQGLESFLDELIEKYELGRYSLVGFTSMFTQNVSSFAMARKLKERNPNIVTVIGGANCETSMGQVIAKNVNSIDFVFSGPALKNFPELVKYLIEGEEEKCHKITGVFSKKRLALQVMGSLNEVGDELDIEEDVPLDYDDFLASFDEKCPSEAGVPALLFETSRGCWWGERSHGTFCGLNGTSMKYRSMKPQKALEQFEKLFDYAPKVSHFKSVDNILPREYLTDVLPHMKTPPNASIFYEVKADLLDREMEVLAKAGITKIQPGIEALATSTLKLMKKGTTSFQNINFLKSCLMHGIKPEWNLLIGFPGEKEDVYKKYNNDLPLLVHLPPPTGVYPVRFDRFSPYFTLAREYGLELKPYDFYGMIYPFGAQDLDELAYFFADHNYRASYIELTAKWIKKLQVRIDRWHTRWLQRDRKFKPRLVFKWRGNSKVVYDSRWGTAVEHEIGAAGLRILDLLTAPRRLPQMAKELGGISETELEYHIASLQQHGLIFQEKDRYMSLIVDSGRDRGYV